MIPISNDFVSITNGSKSLRALAPLGILALVFALNTANVSAESVSISVSSASQSFDLIPGASVAFGKSGDITASIATDYAYGYDFTVSGPDDSGELKSATSHLSSISSAVTETDFKAEASTAYNNKWGFLPSKINSEDNTSYQPAPLNTTPTQIDITKTANSDTVNTYTFAIGARVDHTAVKETYNTTFTLTAVANTMNYSIGFVDATTNMPDTLSGNTSNASITLPANVPFKYGYLFRGWCDTFTTTGYCDGVTYQPGETYDLSKGAITNLYAIFDKATLRLQDVETWGPTLEANVETLALDSRDGKVYRIKRIVIEDKDYDKIWLLDNLALGSDTDVITLTQDNSNIANGFELPKSVSSGFTDDENGRTIARINTQYKDNYSTGLTSYPSNITKDSDGQASWKFGVYYNYCAASAGTICDDSYSTTTNAQYDICPKGWRLPTGGADGEFETLYVALGGQAGNSGYADAYSDLRNTLYLPLPGYANNSSTSYRGAYGLVWSSTYNGATSMYSLGLYNSTVYPQVNYYRYYGNSIRCVAK